MIDRVLIATSNADKAREFEDLFGPAGVWVERLADHADAPRVDETGVTFHDNACLKASAYAKHAGLWTLADDSGLCVDALAGAPGVLSARWADRHGRASGDHANNALLLEQLAGVPDAQRTARFTCALALADATGFVVLTTQESAEGVILREPRGDGGFGYDPIFFVASLARTLAELSPEEKHRVSHRGRAARSMLRQIRVRRSVRF
jgi:XTP/dITP diphosphohydrolase